MVSKGQFVGLDWNRITRLHSQVMIGTQENQIKSNQIKSHLGLGFFFRVLLKLISCCCCFIFNIQKIIPLLIPSAVFIALMLEGPSKYLKQIIQIELNRVKNPN